jgi:hypothetical protein
MFGNVFAQVNTMTRWWSENHSEVGLRRLR